MRSASKEWTKASLNASTGKYGIFSLASSFFPERSISLEGIRNRNPSRERTNSIRVRPREENSFNRYWSGLLRATRPWASMTCPFFWFRRRTIWMDFRPLILFSIWINRPRRASLSRSLSGSRCRGCKGIWTSGWKVHPVKSETHPIIKAEMMKPCLFISRRNSSIRTRISARYLARGENGSSFSGLFDNESR